MPSASQCCYCHIQSTLNPGNSIVTWDLKGFVECFFAQSPPPPDSMAIANLSKIMFEFGVGIFVFGRAI